ncbi:MULTISPECIES: PIN domain-containing protein [Leptolyngbya]|uniref:PIN domain-containing protein n=1 Tax=Leptolyngbya TaxID=47251 RepID=UPI001F5588A2
MLIDDLEIIETASGIHADLRRRGRPIQDADILIAATAIVHSLTVVSNDADLQNVQSLNLENWL